MSFNGFTATDFETFQIDGLERRMQAIRERIQPKFKQIAALVIDETTMQAGREMHLHVAKHARRKVNPPADTWMALCHDKRGYKQHPHFQVGLYDDRAFVWFALIYEAPNKKEIAGKLLKKKAQIFKQIPKEYVLSTDHMKKDAVPFGKLNSKSFAAALERFRDIKKAELLIGRQLPADDPVLQNGPAFIQLVRETIEQLMPVYKLC